MTGRRLILAFLFLLAATACGQRAEPTGTLPLYPVTVPRPGESAIVLPSRPQRVSAVTPPAVEVVRALAKGEGLELNLPGKVELDELRMFRPRLIVASPEASRDELEQAARATKAPVYVFPDSSIRDVEHGMTDLGLLLGSQLKARRLVSGIESKRQAIRSRVGDLKKVTVFVDTGFFVTVPTNSLIGQLVDDAGGHDIAGTTSGPFSLARLARVDPDVYLATSDSGTTLRDLRKNPATAKLRAIRTGRFSVVPADLLQPGPRIGDALVTIAKILHPGAFR
jgi:iron complex transport system substrate-binding protein